MSATAITLAQIEGSGQVLDLVRRGDALTVSQIAQAMGVSRSTSVQRLTHLETAGLVRPQQPLPGTRGRPAVIYEFDTRAGCILAAQVGMTGVRTIVADLAGAVLEHDFVDIGANAGPDALLDAVVDSFGRLLDTTDATAGRLAGIGVGMPSLLDLRASSRSRGDAHEWDLDAMATRLGARFDRPVFLDVDVNMLGLAEHRMSWPSTEVLVCLKLGTSIAASLVVRGEPVRGGRGLAGELGHVKVDGQDEPCACGARGCLDAVASGAALVRQLAALGEPVQHVTDVVRLADEGSPAAVQAVRDAGRHIGATLATVVNLLNPGSITAWGYLADNPLLFAGIRESLHAGALPASTQGLELTSTTLGVLAGARGAALRVADEILSPSSVDRALVAGDWAPALASV